MAKTLEEKMREDSVKKYGDAVCDSCKEKVSEMVTKLKKTDLLFPKRIARKFASAICDSCRENVRARMVAKK